MPQLPFEIPKSLASYAEHFEDDPIRATNRLKKQLKKRGPDAVGYFLLAWFYHLEDMNDQAIEEALKARIFAPGSPFFRKLHYYLSHPDTFEAWIPDTSPSFQPDPGNTEEKPDPVFNLDSLIQRLSEIESKRIQPDKELLKGKSKEAATTDNVDNIVTETLAKIHEQQGKINAAIQVYKRLQELHKDKKEHYKQQINRLNKLKEDQGNK